MMKDFTVIASKRVDGDFDGFDEDALFILQDRTYWLQDEYKYWYHYAYCPTVELLRHRGRVYLRVAGETECVAVRQIFDAIESRIDGEFTGWNGNSQYKLLNGQVWRQARYKYEYKYSYSPEVLVHEGSEGMIMKVAGTSANVRRIA